MVGSVTLLRSGGIPVLQMSTEFLHDGRPQRSLTATMPTPSRGRETKRVVTDPRDEGDVVSVAGGGDGDVGRAPPEELAERRDLFEADTRLQRVDVDAESSKGEDVGSSGASGHSAAWPRVANMS